MHQRKKLLTKTKISKGLWAIIILGFIMFTSVAVYLGYPIITSEVIDPAGLILSSLFLLFGLFSILAPFITYRYSFFDSYFIRYLPLLKKTKKVYYTEIDSFQTVWGQRDAYGNQLIISTTSQKYKISSFGNETSYIEDILKKKARNKRIKDLEINTNWRKFKLNLYIAVPFIILFSFLGIYIPNREEKPITPNDLIQITGTISDSLYKTIGKKERIKLKLKEYPEFNFNISGIQLNNTFDSDLLNSFKKGDTILLQILKTDYDLKIAKTQKATVSQSVNYYFISSYGINDTDGFAYFSLKQYNSSIVSNTTFAGRFCLLVCLFFLFGLLYEYRKYKRKEQEIENKRLEQLYDKNPYE